MWTPGQTVLDRYRLIDQLAEGGGGETWLAQGPHGDVAVKLIRSQDRRRFRDLMREASLLRELRHPRVVHYREFADRPDEQCAILVTDWVPGGDLEAWVGATGPMAPSDVVTCGRQLVEALAVLADAGVLHRDLKPTNVLIDDTADGLHLRVADFGISRPLREGVAMTSDRSLTPQYAAPEQHRGDDELTSAVDLYALGGVLGFLATGAHPGQGGGPNSGDARLDELVSRLMALDPSDRPSLPLTRQALDALATGAPLPDLTPTPPPAAPESPSRALRWIAGVGITVGALGAALVGTATAVWWVADPFPVAPPPAEATSVTAPRVTPPNAATAGVALVPDTVPPSDAPEAANDPAPAPTEAPEKLPPAEPATLFVNSRPWSTVWVDDERVGRTTDLGIEIPLTSGTHTIRLESKAGDRFERTLHVSGEVRLCVNLRLGTEIGC